MNHVAEEIKSYYGSAESGQALQHYGTNRHT